MISIGVGQQLKIISSIEPVGGDSIGKILVVYERVLGEHKAVRTKAIDFNGSPKVVLDSPERGTLYYIKAVFTENNSGADYEVTLEFVDRDATNTSINLNKTNIPDGMTRPVWEQTWPIG